MILVMADDEPLVSSHIINPMQGPCNTRCDSTLSMASYRPVQFIEYDRCLTQPHPSWSLNMKILQEKRPHQPPTWGVTEQPNLEQALYSTKIHPCFHRIPNTGTVIYGSHNYPWFPFGQQWCEKLSICAIFPFCVYTEETNVLAHTYGAYMHNSTYNLLRLVVHFAAPQPWKGNSTSSAWLSCEPDEWKDYGP